MDVMRTHQDLRPWIIVLAYILLIYLSLPLMRPLQRRLYELLGISALSLAVNIVLGLVALAVLCLGLRRGGGTALLLLLILAALGLTAVRIELPEERLHFLEYGLLGLLVHHAGTRHGSRLSFPLLLAITTLAGVFDEGIQHLLPNRVGDLRDILLNTGGGLAGLCTARLLSGTSGPPGRQA